MKKLKKLWQGIFLSGLALVIFPFIDFAKLSLLEYTVLVLLAINIAVEALNLCPED